MIKLILTVCVAAFAVACDTPAGVPGGTTAAEPAKATASETKEAEPEVQAESAAHGDHGEHEHGKAELPADINPGETKYFGDKFTVIEPPITLAAAIETADEHAGPYKVKATIDKVCKNKGCWFTMSDESVTQEIRVRMKDYGFFVPRNADGTTAVVEGTLSSREMSQKEAQHYADDAAKAGEAAEKVEGPKKVWEFTATAIELTKSEG